MTIRQSILKTVYPLLMKAGKWFGMKTGMETNSKLAKPADAFYALSTKSINNTIIDFSQFKGKKVMLVNTASDCGYTGQLSELQKLHELYKDKLVIIGFPSNDFKEQETGSDAEIASFCKRNYGVDFLLTQKSVVTKRADQNPVYQWLSDKNKNGWNDKAPEWNFSKYLVNEQGVLTHYFGPAISPLDSEIVQQF